MPISSDFLHVTKYEVLGPLHDLFTMDDGTPVVSPSDWPARRKELIRHAVGLQYGGMPPAF